jgi:uncharacterized protein (DUF2267 family)
MEDHGKEVDMDYSAFVDAAAEFGFVPDRKTAEAIVKAVLGILASSLTEPLARTLTDFLPKPLDYERLRGHQAKPVAITGDLYIKAVSSQFKLSADDARRVIRTILRLAETKMGSKEIREIIHTLGFEVAP